MENININDLKIHSIHTKYAASDNGNIVDSYIKRLLKYN